ncbi:AGAP002894-PA-like protein [Anopheles sinensis]|uniref:AGAP002894-PA-like protein n=1 Tax=Anopheles sinensis TaxID=74873 RepID=A0A084VFY3_ANOSI|nr:AGAP002894-PA-like protein [Anopheles sinensis]
MFVYTLALFSVVIFLGLRYVFSYWDRHGLPNLKPEIPFGKPAKTRGEKRIIRGGGKRTVPEDNGYFHDRGVFCDEQKDPMSAHLFALPGQKWKQLRGKLTPTFTSGQLRHMMPTFLDVSSKLQCYLEDLVGEGKIVDMRDISARYVLDVVASVFFGFEANCIRNPDDRSVMPYAILTIPIVS